MSDISDEEFIAKQSKEIYALKQENKRLKEKIQKAIRGFVCVGAPLNDNYLQYNNKQREELQRILTILEN